LFQQLKVFCAGAWHNVVICAISFILVTMVPIFMQLLYATNSGVIIIRVDLESPLYGHVVAGDIIRSLSDCEIRDVESWKRCFTYLVSDEYKAKGFCVRDSTVKIFEENERSCCANLTQPDNSAFFCFQDIKEIYELQPICAPAKDIVKDGLFCLSHEDCHFQNEHGQCRKPRTPAFSNFITISLANDANIIYLGPAEQLWYAIEVGGYIPRFYTLSPKIPIMIEKLLFFLMSLSSALALLNMAPIISLDGGWAFAAFINVLFPNIQEIHRKLINKTISILTTVLLGANVIASWRAMS